MSRFEREWSAIPGAARWIAALLGLTLATLLGGVVLIPAVAQHRLALAKAAPLAVLAVVGVTCAAVYVLLIGYVWGDAKRRGMRHRLWALLALAIPNAVGVILYFILRDPLPTVCPACGTPANEGHAYCATCGAALRPTCPQCRQPIDSAWTHCVQCGASLRAVTDRGDQPA
jgi:Double zinc ribbon